MIDTAAARGFVGTLCTQTHRCKISTILQWLGTLWVHCVLCGYTVYSDKQVQNIDTTPVARDIVYTVYSNTGIQNTSMKHWPHSSGQGLCGYTRYSGTQVQDSDHTPMARGSVDTPGTQAHRYETVTTFPWLGALWIHQVLRHTGTRWCRCGGVVCRWWRSLFGCRHVPQDWGRGWAQWFLRNKLLWVLWQWLLHTCKHVQDV